MNLDNEAIEKAVKLLHAGEVVGMPTETVYGLAASIESEAGLNKIFALKDRPFFDPLIVHVTGLFMARELASTWPASCEALARAFWPGPLTMVVPKKSQVSDLITAGLSNVGLRCPRHPVALELIKRAGVALAAPSANKFKRTSPTKKEHVHDEFGEQAFVLEGGESDVGIESTVAGVFADRVEIYRPGMITEEHIQKALESAGLKLPVNFKESPVAPGQLEHHYMPSIPIVLSWDCEKPDLGAFSLQNKSAAVWKVEDEAPLVARKLYSFFREAEKKGHDVIVVKLKSKLKEKSEWSGILNRLSKAKSFEL